METTDYTQASSPAEIDLVDGTITPGLREGLFVGAVSIEECSAMIHKLLTYQLPNASDRCGFHSLRH